jgi:predicted DCC family thiol-disulfide oxidoreductase YuxK
VTSPPATALLYDADCGFCRWSVVQLLRWDDRGRHGLEPVAIQSVRGQQLLAAVPEADRLRTAHVVGPDGTVRSGGDAVPAVTAILPGAAPLGLVARLVPWLVRGGYGVIARHRITVSRFVPRAAKAAADADLARRSGPDTRP